MICAINALDEEDLAEDEEDDDDDEEEDDDGMLAGGSSSSSLDLTPTWSRTRKMSSSLEPIGLRPFWAQNFLRSFGFINLGLGSYKVPSQHMQIALWPPPWQASVQNVFFLAQAHDVHFPRAQPQGIEGYLRKIQFKNEIKK
jgi:hypothetical protein